MATKRGLSIEDAIRGLFPNGYVDQKAYRAILERHVNRHKKKRRTLSLSEPPCSAVDAFAIAGVLLQRAGAYHHVVAGIPEVPLPRLVQVTETDRKSWVDAGEAWRGDDKDELPPPPPELFAAWKRLVAARHQSVFVSAGALSEPPAWWKDALTVLCIADEAARNIGFTTDRDKSAQATYAEVRMRKSITEGENVYTITGADPDQLCVLPKSRTPKVGCTMRSLSHHLSLLPPRGLARSYWTPAWTIDKSEITGAATAFNMLVIPAPYMVRASAFSGTIVDKDWGWFEVAPHWCPGSEAPDLTERGIKKFKNFIEKLVEDARQDVGEVHAIVLPELALSYKVFRELCKFLNSAATKCELVIAGLFDAPTEKGGPMRKGNFAAMARFGTGPSNQREFSISTREKHHRWRLDGAQIDAYALGSSLNANLGWWERIDIYSRSLDVFVLRGNATVTTLICEDLARSDPCQELVRGIGPNLVVALLMDGAQLKQRWPARYATVLADDPGSSVLTLTSFGMVRRSNETGLFDPARQIGLWRDDTGRVEELSLPEGAQALCLSLRPTQLTERTLDGRGDDGDAQSWRLTGVSPVAIDMHDHQCFERGTWPKD